MSEPAPAEKPLFVEFHVLRSYPPSNLNRDDLGSPKSIVFGGERRVRVSSQCLKRTWRLSPFFRGELAEADLGVRTKRVPHDVFERLGATYPDPARAGLEALFAALGKKAAKETGEDEDADELASAPDVPEPSTPQVPKHAEVAETDHLLFLSLQEVDEIVAFAKERAGDFAKAIKAGKKKASVDPKALEKLRKALGEHLEKRCSRNAVDVALFGRFLTSDEFGECNAALQVAHALGTQKLDLEYDFFTAVDDRQPTSEPGAGHIGESELCASVLYEYAVCEMPELLKNLAGDKALAAKAMRAIAMAMCRSIFEKAKRNGTAPHTPADYLEIVLRRDAPMSLANAFLHPVRPNGKADVMDVSIEKLRAQAKKYDVAYGSDQVLGRYRLNLRWSEEANDEGAKATHASLGELAKALEARLMKELGA